MSTGLTIDDKTRFDQRRASNPRASAWVSANAGSGKTKVLTDRVLRLLLDGAPPGRILCLTFTKAAAANMAVKVFDRLGRWVTLERAALEAELADLQGEPPTARQVAEARKLFARAVETPGGLKIETIHAFCERLLHLAPFEANVPASFKVLDEGEAAMLAQGALDSVFADASSGDHPALAQALAEVSAEALGEGLRDALFEAVGKRAFLDHPDGWEAALAQLRRPLGLDVEETAAGIERRMVEEGLGVEGQRACAEALAASRGKTDQELAETLARFAVAPPEEKLALYLTVFFTKDGGARATLGTKSVPQPVRDRLAEEQGRLVGLCERLKAARALERTRALFTLAAEIRRRVERRKGELGALDFDDLIERTKALLTEKGGWILYKLDRGIDHVLVDEAQDTSREQWEILEALTQEFTAGHGARGTTTRTFFAVGDPKQSIYSFQGANPAEFERSKREWERRTKAAALDFEDVPLTLSFRSTSCVLRAVDTTFAVEANYKGLSFGDAAVGTTHASARPRAPGMVELWPVVKRAREQEDPDAWAEPLDEPGQGSPPVRVAQAVAQAIRHWTRDGDDHGRTVPPGEIMVLMRRRGPAFEAVIRALREAGVPVAGQDRLAIHEHIAVLDLVAAGRAALLPEDDLTLAAALKSPLVALTDEDLVRLGACRGDDEPLAWAIAQAAAAGDEAGGRALQALQAWRELARAQGPFGFYATLLGPMGGRAKLVGRLGGEAGDAVDVFLCTAHQAEIGPDAASLANFLARYERQGGRDPAGHTVKRDLEGGRDEVRVMTVHGAKGLEAEVVVVIDGCEALHRHDPCLLPIPLATAAEPVPLWSPGTASDCAAAAAARVVLHEREREEHNRLLYVAMTRAKDRLVIAPYVTGDKDAPEQAWCRMVRESFAQHVGALQPATLPYGEAEVFRDGEAAAAQPRTAVAPALPWEVPDWLHRPAPPEPEPLPPLRPSSALSAADRPARVPEARYDPDARLAGTLVHTLLERLPLVHLDRRPAVAEAYVRARAPSLPRGRRERIVAQALEVLDDPRLRPLFGPGSRPEAPIVGRLDTAQGEVAVSGQIDRLVVSPEEVLVADYKTTFSPPPEGAPAPAPYAGQLALYRALLQDIYPARPVRCFLVWTAGARVQELTASELDAALATIRSA